MHKAAQVNVDCSMFSQFKEYIFKIYCVLQFFFMFVRKKIESIRE